MQQQEVPVRHPPVDQAHRAGVVHGIVVAEHPRQAGAAEHRQQAISQRDHEDGREHRCDGPPPGGGHGPLTPHHAVEGYGPARSRHGARLAGR